MDENKRMDEQAQSLIEAVHFTENVATKIYGVLDEAEIYRAAKEEFAKSKRYDMTIFLLTKDRSKVRVAEASIPFERVGIVEKLTGLGQMKNSLGQVRHPKQSRQRGQKPSKPRLKG